MPQSANSFENSLLLALENPDAALIELDRLDCEDSFKEFVIGAWDVVEPGTKLVWNWHLDVLCAYIEEFFRGTIKKVILNVPPGSMKSLLVSVFGPAWCWAINPSQRFINLTNEKELATRDCVRMRQVLESDWFRARWGSKIIFSRDQNEKTNFANTEKGFRQGLGITGSITGKRGNKLLIDDPLDAQKAFSDAETATVNNTYDNAVSSRLNDLANDGIMLIMQRLRTNDLTGHLMSKKKQTWSLVRIPMEFEPGESGFDMEKDLGKAIVAKYKARGMATEDPRKKKNELMFPARFPRDAVEALKEDLSEYGIAGQLQQRPNPLGGGIIKKQWWRKWPANKPLPFCTHVVASYDTAFTKEDIKSAAYSARTTWGIFEDETTGKHAMILLEAWYERIGYSDLRRKAKQHHNSKYNVDRNLVEKKATGISLVQDFRKIRIPVFGYNPGKMDKIARAYISQPVFHSGLVYYPDRKWAEDVIDHVASFPNGAPPSADLTDTVTQATLYLKKGWWIKPPEEEEPEEPKTETTEEYDEDYKQTGTGGVYG